jgi:DNA recombination protein RmuC
MLLYSICLILLLVALILFYSLQKKNEALACLQIENAKLTVMLEENKKTADEKIGWLEQSKATMHETFKALSFESLEKNQQVFLSLANETFQKFQEKAEGNLESKTTAISSLFDPMKDSLKKLSDDVVLLEKERKADHDVLKMHLKMMSDSEKELKEETSKLVRALRAPATRGRWGELQLKRVVELCGMINHCDFFEQEQSESLRPDMIIRLPGDRQVIVDAKTPFEAYYDALQTEDADTKREFLHMHAKHIRAHIMSLSKKSYWEHFEPTPEFVILFLPSEAFFSAALEYDPTLIEMGIEQKVILATPVSLIGLLRSIAYGWKQEVISRHTKEVYQLGKELYKRIADMHGHLTKVGKHLSSSVDCYNKVLGSWESRVLVTARKFEQLGLSQQEEIDTSEGIENRPRELLASQDPYEKIDL